MSNAQQSNKNGTLSGEKPGGTARAQQSNTQTGESAPPAGVQALQTPDKHGNRTPDVPRQSIRAQVVCTTPAKHPPSPSRSRERRRAVRIDRRLDELRRLAVEERTLEEALANVRNRQVRLVRSLRRARTAAHRISRALALGLGLKPAISALKKVGSILRKRLSRTAQRSLRRR